MRKMAIILLAAILTTACNKDKFDYGLKWDEEALLSVKKGIDAPYQRTNFTLNFFASAEDEITAAATENWITTQISESEQQRELTIVAADNLGEESREGTVEVSMNGKTATIIRLRQDAPPRISTEQQKYTQSADGGELSIRIKANGELTANIYPSDCDWARITKVTHLGDGNYEIHIYTEQNDGLGRIAALTFRVDGNLPVTPDFGPCIVQEPAQFGAAVEVEAPEAGMLPVLQGDDAANLQNIRSLTIVGALNGLDFQVLKQLFASATAPIDLDISECGIVTGNKHPYLYYGWEPNSPEFETFYTYGELPAELFANAVNLRSIRLPRYLKVIGESALNGCTTLRSVVIPESVEEIRHRAFLGCSSMEHIQLSKKSELVSLGNQTFTTGSLLDELYLPFTLKTISSEAFLGCRVAELHLQWPEPPVVNIVPVTDGCTLYVPEGSAELYRSTSNWKYFENIVEEKVDFGE